MRTSNALELVYPESGLPKTGADVYNFRERQTEGGRRRLIKALEYENALLTQMVSELKAEISRARKLLATP